MLNHAGLIEKVERPMIEVHERGQSFDRNNPVLWASMCGKRRALYVSQTSGSEDCCKHGKES